jgi:hypothetical protein
MSLKPILLWVEEYQREREGTPDAAGHLVSRPRGDQRAVRDTGCDIMLYTSLQASLINSRAARERPPLPFNHRRSCLSLRNEGENLGCLEPLQVYTDQPVGNATLSRVVLESTVFFCLWEKVETKKVQTAACC